MDQSTLITFLILVFATVFLLSQVILVPTFGTRSKESRMMRKRLREVTEIGLSNEISLVRQKYMRDLNPIERWLENLPGTDVIEDMIEQSGKQYPAYRIFMVMLGLALILGIGAWFLTHNFLVIGVIVILGLWLPLQKLKNDRKKRLEKFEEQLPDALDMMSRALRAGYPFNDAMKYIADEMPDPIASEFRIVFDEINYGREVKQAFHFLVYRIPSVNLLALTTAIMIQREAGGNLSELLDKVSGVLRKRIKFQRRIKTLTAEGRVSAWVLSLLPLFVFLFLTISSPKFLKPLLETEIGHTLLITGVILQIIGAFWVRKLIDIEA